MLKDKKVIVDMYEKIDRCRSDQTTKQSVLPIQISPVVEHNVEIVSRKNPQRTKHLHSFSQDRSVVSTECTFNEHTKSIKIYNSFRNAQHRKQSKKLYTSSLGGVRITIKCVFNMHTEHIGIHTLFENSCSRQRSRSLYSIGRDGVELSIYCKVGRNTEYIGINTGFSKQPNWKGGAAVNKDCSIYLGVIVAERVLSNVFKNVQRMPQGNIGYDFICNNGFKIDVKSGCGRKNYPNSWMFCISQNVVADYFLCLAFDNRKDLNPMHLWLIPANVLNHLTTTSISISTLDKWKKYELEIDSVLACCTFLKQPD